ncbi:hypothetical protein GOC90_29320 [Sinorhizobium medicae]|nr:hypothetical protein [Sinorhizobium medicae]MDX0457703.1 hypothetical protein [Sinorhizobium medicae]MDX0506603.1 hypothetical protein [Sinorhizobium medicae]MDX0549875.1 hypothetical protein [Sinorhizobium medicae]MDX0593129.1 hypothetical protein [Sinorhizobium medicae]
MPARGERAGTLNRLGDLVPRQCAALPSTHLVQLCSDAPAIICGASPRLFAFFPLGHCPGPQEPAGGRTFASRANSIQVSITTTGRVASDEPLPISTLRRRRTG